MQALRVAVFGAMAASLVGCGGSGSGASSNVPASSVASATSAAGTASPAGSNTANAPAATSHAQAPVPVLLSSDASKNWARVSIRILNVSLTPQGGGAPVTLYTAPSSAPPINLEQLDHINELLATASIPPGTYTGAVVTVAANPGDVALTSSDDPQSGFAAPLSTSIPSQNIEVQDSTGGAGAMTVTIPVTFPAPYVVSATSRTQAPLQVDFSLLNPAFVQSQTPVTHDPTLWAIDFQGAVSGQPISDITSLVLRQMYGTLSAVAADGKSITVTRDYPLKPAATPEAGSPHNSH